MTTGGIEQVGRDLVRPLIESWIQPGCLWDTNSARQTALWQRFMGDYAGKTLGRDELVGIEVKTEQRYTGNLFVESWSNKSHYRTRDGWIFTLNADVLVMVYLDVRAAMVMRLDKLKHWCLEEGNLYRFPEKLVHRSADGEQKNQTVGYPIPFVAILEPVGITCYRMNGGDTWGRCKLFDIELSNKEKRT
jgi:hypothetical protein